MHHINFYLKKNIKKISKKSYFSQLITLKFFSILFYINYIYLLIVLAFRQFLSKKCQQKIDYVIIFRQRISIIYILCQFFSLFDLSQIFSVLIHDCLSKKKQNLNYVYLC